MTPKKKNDGLGFYPKIPPYSCGGFNTPMLASGLLIANQEPVYCSFIILL